MHEAVENAPNKIKPAYKIRLTIYLVEKFHVIYEKTDPSRKGRQITFTSQNIAFKKRRI